MQRFLLLTDNFKKIVYPAFVQEKIDGCRVNLIKEKGCVKVITRYGNVLNLLDVCNDDFKVINEGEVWDGEITFSCNRVKSNGIALKAIRGSISKEEAECCIIRVWDIVDNKNTYVDRLTKLTKRFENRSFRHLKLIETSIVKSYDEVDQFYTNIIKNGGEGCVVKNINSKWKDGRSFDCVKIKEKIILDGTVVSVVEGKDKYTGMLGSIKGIVVIDGIDRNITVGGGFKDIERRELWLDRDNIIGRPMKIICNEVVRDVNGTFCFIYLARFLKWI